MNKTSIIEALIFSTNRGLDISQLTRFTDFSKTEVESILTEIQERYENEEHGIRLKRVGKKYGFFTKEEYAEYVERLVRRPVDKLTPSQLEVLAIVAKNGKSTKSQVEVVRGKDCSNQLLELLLSGLLKRKRVKAPGRPYAYSVTDNFYEIFKMSDLELYEELGEDMPNEAEENDEAKTMIE
jgi:segregation and condensation protein B